MSNAIRKQPYDRRIRCLAALRLAVQGMTFREIGEQFGFSTERAHQLVDVGWRIIAESHPALKPQARMIEIRGNSTSWLSAIDQQTLKIEQNRIDQPGDTDLENDPFLPIQRLSLSVRCRNCLRSENLHCVEDLLRRMEENGQNWGDGITGLGVGSKKEIEDAVQGFERARNALQQHTPVRKGCRP